MKRIYDLTKKNLKLLIRSKSSALIIILGPLFIIFLAGLAFDNANFYQFKIGTYADSYSSLSNSFVSKLSDTGHGITRFDSEDLCVDAVKNGESHACLLFPKDFNYEVNNDITFYVDQSKINIAGAILDAISSEISSRNDQISEELTTKLIEAFNTIESEATNKKATIISLTSDNDVMVKSVQQTTDTLNLLELTIDVSAFKGSELTSVSSNISKLMSNLSSNSNRVLEDLISELDIAYELVADINISSSDRNNIQDAIFNAGNKTLEIKNGINATNKLTNLQLFNLANLINNINSQINYTQSKMNQVASAKDAAIANLNVLKTTADESLIKILELQKGFNSIQQTIKSIEIKDAGTISQPITTTITPVVASGTYLNYVFPSLIALILMFTALLLAPTLVVLEKKSSAYLRNFISPAKEIHYIISTFLTCALILFVQILLIVLIAIFAFSSDLAINFLSTGVIILLLITVFTLLGMLVGYIINSQAIAILTSIGLGSISLFLSDVIIPLESMPAKILSITNYNPFLIGSSALRKALLFDVSLMNLGQSLSLLFGYALVLFLLVYALHHITKRGSIAAFLHHNLIKKK